MTTDQKYAMLIDYILRAGETVQTRNSMCRRVFAQPITFASTPLVSLRRTAWKNSLREWEWFMSGSNNIDDLHPSVHPWWKPWADGFGIVRNNYSRMFRHFPGGSSRMIDQIRYLVDGTTQHPFSRRNCITTWNTADMADSSTPITNCHTSFLQAYVNPDRTLHLMTVQRSADVIVGLGANWLQSWAFLLWLAHRSGTRPGTLTWIGGDVHIYEQHLDLAGRIAKADQLADVPELVYQPSSPDFKADDFSLSGPYVPVIDEKAEMVV